MQTDIKQVAHNHWIAAYQHEKDRVIYIVHFKTQLSLTDRKGLSRQLNMYVPKRNLHISTVLHYKDTNTDLELMAKNWLKEQTDGTPLTQTHVTPT